MKINKYTIMNNNRLLTEIDLQINFKSKTGINAYKKKPMEYTSWLEEKLLKFMNDKRKVDNLFVE